MGVNILHSRALRPYTAAGCNDVFFQVLSAVAALTQSSLVRHSRPKLQRRKVGGGDQLGTTRKCVANCCHSCQPLGRRQGLPAAKAGSHVMLLKPNIAALYDEEWSSWTLLNFLVTTHHCTANMTVIVVGCNPLAPAAEDMKSGFTSAISCRQH